MSASKLRGHKEVKLNKPCPERHSVDTRINTDRHLGCANGPTPGFDPDISVPEMWVNQKQRPPWKPEEDRHAPCQISHNYASVEPAHTYKISPRRRIPEVLKQEFPIITNRKMRSGDRDYLTNVASVYSVANLKQLKQKQYKELLIRQFALGFNTDDEYLNYWQYIEGPRKRVFGGLESTSPSLRTSKTLLRRRHAKQAWEDKQEKLKHSRTKPKQSDSSFHPRSHSVQSQDKFEQSCISKDRHRHNRAQSAPTTPSSSGSNSRNGIQKQDISQHGNRSHHTGKNIHQNEKSTSWQQRSHKKKPHGSKEMQPKISHQEQLQENSTKEKKVRQKRVKSDDSKTNDNRRKPKEVDVHPVEEQNVPANPNRCRELELLRAVTEQEESEIDESHHESGIIEDNCELKNEDQEEKHENKTSKRSERNDVHPSADSLSGAENINMEKKNLEGVTRPRSRIGRKTVYPLVEDPNGNDSKNESLLSIAIETEEKSSNEIMTDGKITQATVIQRNEPFKTDVEKFGGNSECEDQDLTSKLSSSGEQADLTKDINEGIELPCENHEQDQKTWEEDMAEYEIVGYTRVTVGSDTQSLQSVATMLAEKAILEAEQSMNNETN